MSESSSIPAGFCQCGCGVYVGFWEYNNPRDGRVKGEPKRFVSGHNKRIPKAAIICAHCGATFYVIPSRAERVKFCSRNCSTDAERQQAQHRLDNDYTVDPDTGCWIWDHCKSRGEYAKISRDKQARAVYGLKWEEENGPQPSGTTLHHLCETPACIRPSHLQLLTRGGHASLHHAELTNADKQQIRRLRYELGMKAKDIAEIYDIDPSAISRTAPTDYNEPQVSPDTVRYVRQRLAKGHTNAAIAEDVGFSATTISHIRTGKRYSWC